MRKILVGILLLFILMNVNALVTIVDASIYSIKIPVLTSGEPVYNPDAQCRIKGNGTLANFYITEGSQFGTFVKKFNGYDDLNNSDTRDYLHGDSPPGLSDSYVGFNNKAMAFERNVSNNYYLNACVEVETGSPYCYCDTTYKSIQGARNWNKQCLDDTQDHNYLHFECYSEYSEYGSAFVSTAIPCGDGGMIEIEVTPNWGNKYCLPLGQI